MISIHDPADTKAWSGTPHSVERELRAQVSTLEVIGPLSRWFRYLYAPAKVVASLTHHPIHFDRHPFALSSYARQIERRLRGRSFDAIVCLSSVPIAHLRTGIPIFCWNDGVLEGFSNYYLGIFSGMTPAELAIGHHQEKSSLERSAFAIYSSAWAVETVKRHYTEVADKLRVIEFGSNLPTYHDRTAVLGFIEQRLRQPIQLLFVGVEWERKGGPLAWEATRLLNARGIPARLTVVGCDAPEAPFVQCSGFLSKATPEGCSRLAELYTQASFFLFPTRAEASAIVFCEAASFGLPVLSTETGGVGNYVIDGETGFRLPLSAPAECYADLIQQTFDQPDTYRRLSVGSYSLYESTLNWRVGVHKLLQLIERTIEAPNHAS